MGKAEEEEETVRAGSTDLLRLKWCGITFAGGRSGERGELCRRGGRKWRQESEIRTPNGLHFPYFLAAMKGDLTLLTERGCCV